MPEEVKDVNTTESSTEEKEVVNTGEQETSSEQTTTQETTEQTQEESKPQQQFSPVDERGVPWMNRFYESERKSKELLENIETKMAEMLSKQSTPQQREYSISELETFAMSNPNYRPWVEEEKAKIIQKNVSKATQDEIKVVDEKRTAEGKRQNAYSYVVQSYPDCFLKDNFGNLQWNNQSPLVQQIGMIMNDSRFKNDPEGLIAAADMAYGRIARMQSGQNQKKVKTLEQTLRKTQKGTLTEGSGTQEAKSSKDEFTKAKERLSSKPGNKDAARDAVKAYLKKTGVIE